MWERRYGAVRPARTGTNRRAYPDEDLQRLIYLREATRSGHSIGNITGLPTDKLAALASERRTDFSPHREQSQAERFVADALGAIRGLDARKLEDILSQAIVALGQHALLVKVIGPIAQA